MIVFKCPKCEAETKLSLLDSNWEGPRRCWKCRELFTIKIENDEITSCEPLSEEDFQKWQEIEALKHKLQNE